MAQTDALKKYLDAGMAFTHLTRARAEQVVKDLVAAGELQKNQAKEAIDELLDRSRKNAETLSEQVRKEVDSQLASLGLARKADVERLLAELAELRGKGGKGGKGDGPAKEEAKDEVPTKKAAPAKKAPAKKAKPAAEDGGGDHGRAKEKLGEKPEGKEAASGSGDTPSADDGSSPPDPSMPAKQANKAAPNKTTKKVSSSEGETSTVGRGLPTKKAPEGGTKKAPVKRAAPKAGPDTVSAELPAKKAAAAAETKKAAPAKKAAKKSDGSAVPSDRSTPAKKTSKKQG